MKVRKRSLWDKSIAGIKMLVLGDFKLAQYFFHFKTVEWYCQYSVSFTVVTGI